MDILFIIILLVIGILQIILFFKIWGMTNNVRALKGKPHHIMPRCSDEMPLSQFKSDFYFLSCNGYKDEAKRLLLSRIWECSDMATLIRCKNLKTFDETYANLKSAYSYFFEYIGEEFPTYNQIRKDKEASAS
ncbi:hypothetical protein M2132_001570 [Dysgonomonas sp. PH5-45]|uniref:hypothetical protein n=1 Tax=unclassified Dysgonomonas TaxID=2630389 RepID=UPI0024770A65|nr:MULTISPECIES: hypothetical protein [unclassified Dysgonomonas]MDH6355232.1 hypothetical protein [Dysgonomonas sp. PH5-45]MDH6388145.1 hypothetical protein [Dysgonomonas sp. PH5-37]